jgi:hypothetical protein
MRTQAAISLTLLTLGLFSASSCIQGIGGDGQACSSDGKCAVGLFCQSNVCRAPNAGVGGSVATSGGTNGSGGASARDGGSAGDGPGESGGASVSGGKDGGGAANSGGSDGESGGSVSSGGAESSGGSDGSGGSDPGPSGTNLLQNGDFSDGEAHWKCDCGNATKGVKDGAYCVEGSGDIGLALSAPGEGEEPFALETDKTYTLYYRVKGTGSWKSKVGLAVDPYTPFGEWDDAPNSAGSYMVFTHDFTVAEGDERVGFIFQGTVKGSACFDDVFIGLKE